MAKYGIPQKFIAIVKSFHDGMLARTWIREGRQKPSGSQMVSNKVAYTLQCIVICHAENCIS